MASQVAHDEGAIPAEIMSMLEAEPGAVPSAGGFTAGPDIPALREQLAILVSTGKAKEAIGAQLTHEQVKRLSDKDVEKYYKRYESYIGGKTTETIIESFLMLATKAVGMALPIKNVEALQKELQNNYIISKELSTLAGTLALKCGSFLALASAALITTNHIDFAARPPRAADDELPEQSPEQLPST